MQEFFQFYIVKKFCTCKKQFPVVNVRCFDFQIVQAKNSLKCKLHCYTLEVATHL